MLLASYCILEILYYWTAQDPRSRYHIDYTCVIDVISTGGSEIDYTYVSRCVVVCNGCVIHYSTQDNSV